MTDMVLQNDFPDIVDRRPDCGKLDQNIAAFPAFFHHSLYGLHVADRPGHPVYDLLCILMLMLMIMLIYV
jgi:hypothetical protein